MNQGTGEGQTYSGYNTITAAIGLAAFTLPQGSYHFRADYQGVPFWSSAENGCALPGCTSASVHLPGSITETVTIDYSYDPLNRLTAAEYSDSGFYYYAYDAVGNRLTQMSMVDGVSTTMAYAYDDANRLIDVDGVDYTWDANGNLLDDGLNEYAYDAANHLTEFEGPEVNAAFAYNGLGDRLQQTANGQPVTYTLDLDAGLTQVLDDGTNAYVYGLNRISQIEGASPEYFLGDALGSVRQLTNQDQTVTLSQSYDPYGNVITSTGSGETAYSYTGELIDASGLIYLRARYYAPEQGRFFQQDPWSGVSDIPATFNPYLYGLNNPVIYTDPSGQCPIPILCQLLIGGFIGGLTGAAIGAIYAGFMYDLALQGKCGCEGAQLILQQSKTQFMLKAAGEGALFGAVLGGLAFLGAGGAAAAALVGMGLSSVGVISSAQRLAVDIHNECAWWDLGLSFVGLLLSGFSLHLSARNYFYNKAVQYESSSSALIGKYREGSPLSYEQLAKKLKFSHLDLAETLNKYFKLVFGESAWWKLINEPFIRALAGAKKLVYVTQNPNLPATSNLALELNLLKELGYIGDGFVKVNGIELWRLVPTR